MFLVSYERVSLLFLSQDTASSSKQFAVATYQHYWERSLVHFAKSRIQRTSNEGVFGSRIFLLCTSLKYKYSLPLTDIWHSGLYPIQIGECGRSQDILLLKGTKHQFSLFDKMPIVNRFFRVSLTLQFR